MQPTQTGGRPKQFAALDSDDQDVWMPLPETSAPQPIEPLALNEPTALRVPNESNVIPTDHPSISIMELPDVQAGPAPAFDAVPLPIEESPGSGSALLPEVQPPSPSMDTNVYASEPRTTPFQEFPETETASAAAYELPSVATVAPVAEMPIPHYQVRPSESFMELPGTTAPPGAEWPRPSDDRAGAVPDSLPRFAGAAAEVVTQSGDVFGIGTILNEILSAIKGQTPGSPLTNGARQFQWVNPEFDQ